MVISPLPLEFFSRCALTSEPCPGPNFAATLEESFLVRREPRALDVASALGEVCLLLCPPLRLFRWCMSAVPFETFE